MHCSYVYIFLNIAAKHGSVYGDVMKSGTEVHSHKGSHLQNSWFNLCI